MDILEILKEDYRKFPKDQTYALYAEDVYFKDPLNEFRGRDRYQKMIRFIDALFIHPHLELHHIQQTDNHIRSDWTLSWISPLPWKPQVHITGWSELELNAEGLISSHIDYWCCSRWQVLQQNFPWHQKRSGSRI
jgi:hypothetical protein